MNMPSLCIDRLEQTKAADDPENDCPLFLRLTGLWNYPFSTRVNYHCPGSMAESFRSAEKHAEHKKPVTRKHLYIWAIIDNRIMTGTCTELAEKMGVRVNSISGAKSARLKVNPKALEATLVGIRFGWGPPPCDL